MLGNTSLYLHLPVYSYLKSIGFEDQCVEMALTLIFGHGKMSSDISVASSTRAKHDQNPSLGTTLVWPKEHVKDRTAAEVRLRNLRATEQLDICSAAYHGSWASYLVLDDDPLR